MKWLVLKIDRAEGCRPELRKLLSDWVEEGSHDVIVAEDGGYRVGPEAEAKQETFFATGMSKARTLKETPHGRRCAVDVWPVGFNPHRSFDDQPGMRDKFLLWGRFVESKGFKWGGRFKSFGDGDMPHCEIPAWHARFRFPDGEPIRNGLDEDTK